MDRFYPIGTPGQPWTEADKAAWFAQQHVKRSYREQVLDKLAPLRTRFDVRRYGALEIDPQRYPLFAVECRATAATDRWALITGGVHGYETSGVHGALEFAGRHAQDYAGRVNLLVAPCVSPWAYERVHRWNPDAIDPNRSFREESPAAESAALMRLVATLRDRFVVHIDLHETTDSDESEFRPALAARDGKPFEPGIVPDGFYLVGDSEDPQPEFQRTVIAAVEQVTHIAPADADGAIIGEPVVSSGVINYPVRALGLCTSITTARYRTITEVYPDSPRATPAQCIAAQVAAVRAAIEYALERQGRAG
jgi:hypothetical protein